MRRRPWGDVPQPTRRRLRAILRDLGGVYDLRGLLAWRMAQQAAELWLVTQGVSLEAVVTSEQRRRGRGRRANRKLVNQTAKRQGQHLETLTKTLAQLGALAGTNGHGADPLEALARDATRQARAQ